MDSRNASDAVANDLDDESFDAESLDAAIDFVRRDIDDLIERAEALELDTVANHLNRASKLCIPRMPN